MNEIEISLPLLLIVLFGFGGLACFIFGWLCHRAAKKENNQK